VAAGTRWSFPYWIFAATVASFFILVVAYFMLPSDAPRCVSGLFGVTECGVEAISTYLIWRIPIFGGAFFVYGLFLVLTGFGGSHGRQIQRGFAIVGLVGLWVVGLWTVATG
jgi:hypothetical protein